MEAFACLMIVCLFALLINHYMSLWGREGLAGSACTVSGSSPSACRTIASLKNTYSIKHADELMAASRQRISDKVNNVTKSVEAYRSKIIANVAEILHHRDNATKMYAAAVKEEAAKKKKKK